MSGKDYDWTRFRRRVYVAASPDVVFRAWATPAGLVAFFIRKAAYVASDGFPRADSDVIGKGDAYHWKWHQDGEIRGTVLEVVPDERVSFTFGKKDDGSGEEHRVTVTLEAAGGRTRVDLVQENMADTPESRHGWHLSCNLGWSFFLTNLKAVLEHGIDLRETDPDLAYETRAITLP